MRGLRHWNEVAVAAPPSAVWALLGRPTRWPSFDPTLSLVRGAGDAVRSGQRLVATARGFGLRVPVDIDYAEPDTRLEVSVRVVPGLSQVLEFVVVPRSSGGSQVVVRVATSGALAPVAVLPSALLAALRLRLLAHRAEAEFRRGSHSPAA